MRLNARVLAALLAQDEPDLARVVHHAVRGRRRRGGGRPRPGGGRGRRPWPERRARPRRLYEQALRRRELLAAEDRAAIAEAYAWALFHSDRRARSAARPPRRRCALREDLGDDAALGQALACLSVQQWSGLQTGGRARVVGAGRATARARAATARGAHLLAAAPGGTS